MNKYVTHYVAFLIGMFGATALVPLAGCGAIEEANESVSDTVLEETTSPEGETALEPDPAVTQTIETVSGILPKWGEIAGGIATTALGLYAGIENRRRRKEGATARVLVENVDQALAELEKAVQEGAISRERKNRLTAAIQAGQAGADVWRNVDRILRERGK